MPYVDRNPQGHIVSIFNVPQSEGQEFLEVAELYVPPPAPLDQIRALEAENADGMVRMTRVALLQIALDRAIALGYTHENLMALDNGYRDMYLLEQEISALRDLL